MEVDFVKLMTTKSDEGLQEYIDNRQKFTPLAVYAAIDELKKRGRTFTDEEFTQIVNDIEKQQELGRQRTAEESVGFWGKMKKNVVTDTEAPEYYSETAIYTFSIFFSVLFGSVLMTMNASKTEKKDLSWTVLLFGISYTVLQMWVLSYVPGNSTGLTVGASIGGAIILNQYFSKNTLEKIQNIERDQFGHLSLLPL
ncbi:MAG: hypothetical protein IPJ32_11850 [Sphingobacteriaceae bacterium]|nr:hypothetical protein [Sphingobacteriaceae bacterium]